MHAWKPMRIPIFAKQYWGCVYKFAWQQIKCAVSFFLYKVKRAIFGFIFSPKEWTVFKVMSKLILGRSNMLNPSFRATLPLISARNTYKKNIFQTLFEMFTEMLHFSTLFSYAVPTYRPTLYLWDRLLPCCWAKHAKQTNNYPRPPPTAIYCVARIFSSEPHLFLHGTVTCLCV